MNDATMAPPCCVYAPKAIGNAALLDRVAIGDRLCVGARRASHRGRPVSSPARQQPGGRQPDNVRLLASSHRSLVQGKTVVCEAKDTDRYGRTVAICRASGEDLGAIMVREGMAWAFVRYSRDYVGQESRARADRLGVHAHGCTVAWEWRAQQR